jgi:hypothetical protein
MPNSHKINIKDDIWPKRNEWVKYIYNSKTSDPQYYYEEPSLTMGQFYQIRDIKWIPCKDQIQIVDDHLQWFWVDLVKFNYSDNIDE